MENYTKEQLLHLPSFARLSRFVGERRQIGPSPEATFEAYEKELGRLMRAMENEVKAAELARYDVEAEVVMVGGAEWRRCLDNKYRPE